jgi:hypothetical protein
MLRLFQQGGPTMTDEIETGGGDLFLLKGSAGVVCNVEHINRELRRVIFSRALDPRADPEDMVLTTVLTLSAADVRQMMALAARYLPA